MDLGGLEHPGRLRVVGEGNKKKVNNNKKEEHILPAQGGENSLFSSHAFSPSALGISLGIRAITTSGSRRGGLYSP